MSTPLLAVGQKIELNDGRTATVRFYGSTSFQTGDWVGVELEEASGKNDGSVKGERYFDCEPNYGMFCRPAGIRQVLDAPKRSGLGNGVRSRPSSVQTGVNGLKRQSVADAKSRRASVLSASPTPGSRLGTPGGLRSPAKSPTKQLGSTGPSSSSTSRTNTPPVGRRPAGAATSKPRASIAPQSTAASRKTSVMPPASASASRTVRPSLAGPTASARAAPPTRPLPGRVPSGRLTAPQRPAPAQRVSSLSTRGEDTSETSSQPSDLLSPKEDAFPSGSPSPMPDLIREDDDDDEGADDTITKPSFAPPPIPSPRLPMTRRTSSPPASIASHRTERTARSTQASQRQIEELEAKVRLLERKRLEDRDLRNTLEKTKQEKDKYESMIQKISTKYQPLQSENAELKKQVKEYASRFADIEAMQAEHDSIMEMATLDREVAEETAEGLKAELDALRIHNDLMKEEIEVLRDENEELNKDISPEEKGSVGWLQLEKSNERLKEALLRLRDVTQDRETELRDQIKDLESQVKAMDGAKTQFEETREKLLQSEAAAEDLRQQLEIAEGSEDMIEELTDTNMSLQKQLDDLRATISDLEDLKELNDELEVNHVEAEKQLQEEIDFKDHLLHERTSTAKQMAAALEDAEYTITRFRELVTTLQSDLADLQASKQITESEAKALSSKSNAMLDLNLKLQSSAQKTQVKTIDLELRRLEAQEASEHLAIVQLFLPEAFHAERHSVLALLRFKRISFKANLVHGFVKERIAAHDGKDIEEDVFAACDAMDKLTWVAAISERFVNSICSCAVEELSSYEGALYELEPVERALNGYIDALRRDELKMEDVADELARSMEVMTHLASIHIKDDLAAQADEMIMRTACLQSRLESAAAALGIMRSIVERNVPGLNDEDEGYEDDEPSDLALILNRADNLVTHARSAKVMAGKTQRALMELHSRSLTLEQTCLLSFTSTDTAAAEVSNYTRQAGTTLQTFFSEEGRNDAFVPAEVTSTLSRAATTAFSLSTPEAGPFAALSSRLRSLTDKLTDLAALPTDLDNTVEFERAPAPWVSRAAELKKTKLTTVDTEAELARMTETARERAVQLKAKDTELEETALRVEMLEARMRDAGKRSARIAELEGRLHECLDREKRQKHELARVESEGRAQIERVREEMSRMAEERVKGGARNGDLEAGAIGAGARLTLQRQEHRIASLQAAVRFLQDENMRLRLPAPDAPRAVARALDWLHEPLVQPSRPRSAAARDKLAELLRMAARPPLVELTGLPRERLAWRAVKESSRWKIERGKEEWEGWRAGLGC